MWFWETLFFFCVKQKHKYIKSSTSKRQVCVPPLLISQKWLNLHYRPRFVFHYWPQNVCFLCVLPDLQTATSDNIFSWIIPKHQYKASECLSLPLKTPCLQTPQDWLFAYPWTKYEIVVSHSVAKWMHVLSAATQVLFVQNQGELWQTFPNTKITITVARCYNNFFLNCP